MRNAADKEQKGAFAQPYCLLSITTARAAHLVLSTPRITSHRVGVPPSPLLPPPANPAAKVAEETNRAKQRRAIISAISFPESNIALNPSHIQILNSTSNSRCLPACIGVTVYRDNVKRSLILYVRHIKSERECSAHSRLEYSRVARIEKIGRERERS